jgi:uncharacterized membrane protein YozB (DUF420 family)
MKILDILEKNANKIVWIWTFSNVVACFFYRVNIVRTTQVLIAIQSVLLILSLLVGWYRFKENRLPLPSKRRFIYVGFWIVFSLSAAYLWKRYYIEPKAQQIQAKYQHK